MPSLPFVALFAITAATSAVASPAVDANFSSPIDASRTAGADIGAKVTAAMAALPASGGTVRIPAGNYSFATTMRITHQGQQLLCDPGAMLHYTGSGDAILIDLAAGASQEIEISGGCLLEGTPAAQNGIHMTPGNTITLRGLRIRGFKKGNAVALSGANTVEILECAIYGNHHGIDMTTVPDYAPNAVHVADNNISDNDWGVYSWNAHVRASRALGNVYRDNVFEGNRLGDLFLSWDAHTLVEGNYFESSGVGVAIGTGGNDVFNVHVSRNYFTAGNTSYRSEVEIGDAADVYVEGNYEEGVGAGGAATATGCAVDIVPGIRGGAHRVFLRNAFSRVSEGRTSPHEICYAGKAQMPPGILGTWRMAGDLAIDGAVRAKGAQLAGELSFAQGAVASTAEAIKPGLACPAEGTLLIAHPPSQTAQLYFCSGLRWRPVVLLGAK